MKDACVYMMKYFFVWHCFCQTTLAKMEIVKFDLC